jgi:hypothetical protein
LGAATGADCGGKEKVEAVSPARLAMACSSRARRLAMSAAWARAVSSRVRERSTSSLSERPLA